MLGGPQVSILVVLDHKGGHVHRSQARVAGVIFGLPARDQAEPTVSHVHQLSSRMRARVPVTQQVLPELPGRHGLAPRSRRDVAAAGVPGAFLVEAEPDP
jgi:hypothetical protein